jgi:glycosyltransferase involved in cell wall biosynthesis
MHKISAVIISFNEEKKIAACLASLQGVVDEIIVLDSFSIDKTVEICKQFGAKVFQQKWSGYGQQKNDAAAKASHDYILSLDADEYLSATLQQSIIKAKKAGLKGAYKMNRMNIFFGYALKYGLTQPDKITRLYDKKSTRWGLRNAHETLELNKNTFIELLQGNLVHHSKDSMDEFISTINTYSTLSAKYYMENGKKSNIFKILLNPSFTFFKGYLFRLGFLDGMPGLVIALTMSLETFLKYSKLYFLQCERKK